MSKLAARKKRVKRTVSIGRVVPEAVEQVEDLDSRIEAIQWLIPLGLKAVTEELHRAVIELAGPRYERKESDQPLRRWGSQPRSVYLGDQKLPVEVPRVRNVASDTEVPLNAYQALQTPRQMDEGLPPLRMLKGIATRHYEACAQAVPEAFGLSSSSVSRRYVKGTARKLAQFQGAPWKDTTWWRYSSTARASPTRRSSSPWASYRRPRKTSVFAVASCPIWSTAVCSTKPDCWSSWTAPRGSTKR